MATGQELRAEAAGIAVQVAQSAAEVREIRRRRPDEPALGVENLRVAVSLLARAVALLSTEPTPAP